MIAALLLLSASVVPQADRAAGDGMNDGFGGSFDRFGGLGRFDDRLSAVWQRGDALLLAAGESLPSADAPLGGDPPAVTVENGTPPYRIDYVTADAQSVVLPPNDPLSAFNPSRLAFLVGRAQAEPHTIHPRSIHGRFETKHGRPPAGPLVSLPCELRLTDAAEQSDAVRTNVAVEVPWAEATALLAAERPGDLRLAAAAWPEVVTLRDDRFPDPPLVGGTPPHSVAHVPGGFPGDRYQRHELTWRPTADELPEYVRHAVLGELRAPNPATRVAEFAARAGRPPEGRPVWVRTRIEAADAAGGRLFAERPVLVEVPTRIYDRLAGERSA